MSYSENHFYQSDTYQDLIKQLESALGFKSTTNLNLDVDIAVKRAKDGDQVSRNWLILNFLPLIIKITFSPVIKVKNPYSGSIEPFSFGSRDSELEVKDLLSHLINKFVDFITDYNWESAFNYWIEMRLKWACINYRNHIKKISNRESSLDEFLSEARPGTFNDEDDEERTVIDIIETRSGMWNTQLTERQQMEDKDFVETIDRFAKQNFTPKEYEIYIMFFIEDMSILDITAHYKQTYHSTISYTVADLKRRLREFLSKIDEYYDELNQKYDKQEAEKNITMADLPPDTDFGCEDLMPKDDMDDIMRDIEMSISERENND